MHKPGYLLTFAACLVVSGACSAQTIYGANGLLVHPTAYPSPYTGLRLNLSYLNTQDRNEGQVHYIPLNLTYGVNSRFEVGATYLNRVEDGHNRASGGLNGRYILTPDAVSHPAVAVSGSFLAGDFRRSSAGLLVSHQFTCRSRPLFVLHTGVLWVQWQSGQPVTDGVTEYIGASVPLGRQFSLLGEMGTRLHFDEAAESSVGIQWNDSRSGAAIGIGYVNIGQSRNGGIFIGAGYALGGHK